jgi:hypothetical protein
MKFCLAILLLLNSCNNIFATNIKASQIPGHPYSAINATDAFQTAGNYSVDTVIIDFVSTGEWIINATTFFNLNNKTFIFENAVKLIAASGYGLDDCLFKLRFCNNVKLIGTNTLFRMQKQEYTTGEFRHCFAIADCDNIEASNFIMQDSGGDGVFIAAFAAPPAKQYSENIILRNIICDNNRRQGISLISVQNLLLEHCSFKNTKGTLPEAGLDLEPDAATERLVNIEFRRCSFTNNFGNGIQLAMLNLRNTSTPISVTFNDCYVSQNSITTNTAPGTFYQKCEISAGASESDFVTGQVNFNRCLVENSQWTALAVRKAANSYGINFNDCVFKNVSQAAINFNNPIWLELVSYDAGSDIPFGGVNFNNQLIDFSTNMPFMQVYGSTDNNANLGNVAGNITVKNNIATTAPLYVSTTNDPSANYTFNFLQNYPTANLSVLSSPLSIHEITCNKSFFTYLRSNTSNALPMPISYTLNGTASNEKDFFHLPPFVIIPSQSNMKRDTIFGFNDLLVEPMETISLNTNPAENFTIANGNFSIDLSDGNCQTVLPVQFINISAKKQFKENHIQFIVANEEINTSYIIEKSLNGINFFNVGSIQANATTTGNATHIFIDKNQLYGTNFYRVKQFQNGQSLLSQIVSVFNGADEAITVYPNPTKHLIKINTANSFKNIQVYNATGQLVLSFDGQQNTFNVSTLTKGIYFLKIINENNSSNKLTFVKE